MDDDEFDDGKKPVGCLGWSLFFGLLLVLIAAAGLTVLFFLGPPGPQTSAPPASSEWAPKADSRDEGDLRAFRSLQGGTIRISDRVYVTHSGDGSISVLVKHSSLDEAFECQGGTDCSVTGLRLGSAVNLSVVNYLGWDSPVYNVAVTPEGDIKVTYKEGGRCYGSSTASGDVNIVCPGASAQAAIDALHPPPPPPPEPPADPPAATP